MADRLNSRRDLLKAGTTAATLALLTVPVMLLPKEAEAATDPVFAAIAEHEHLRSLHASAFDAAAEAERAHGPDSPQTMAAERLRDALSDREMEGLEQVMRTVPTTSAGMLAWLDHLAGPAGFEGMVPREEDMEAIFGTMRAFVAKTGGA